MYCTYKERESELKVKRDNERNARRRRSRFMGRIERRR
jgi:hypothetical protein